MPEVPVAHTPGVWELRIEPWLSRYAMVLVVCLVIAACALIFPPHTFFPRRGEDPAHVPGGLESLPRHPSFYETHHPPLTRAMIALLPYLSGTRFQGKD